MHSLSALVKQHAHFREERVGRPLGKAQSEIRFSFLSMYKQFHKKAKLFLKKN
jgi:hypothetical protein